MVTVGDLEFEPYIGEEEIQKIISKIADEINAEYKGRENKPIFLVTLSGALFFSADLLRKLDFLPLIGFVKCSSFGNGITSTGTVQMKLEPTLDIAGKDVIVLEDIVDTGITWVYLREYLLKKGAARVRIASLLEKDNEDNIHADWAGCHVGKEFVVGMGMDYAELGRNLSEIYKITT